MILFKTNYKIFILIISFAVLAIILKKVVIYLARVAVKTIIFSILFFYEIVHFFRKISFNNLSDLLMVI